MTKAELVSAVAEKAGITKKAAEAAISATVASVTEALGAGEDVTLVGFGTFKVVERAARTYRNPQNGEPVEAAAKKVPVFKAGKALKEAVK